MSADNGQVIDVTSVEEVTADGPQSVAVAPAAVAPPVLAVAPQATPKDLVARLDAIKETQKVAMVKGVDYGEIPGTNKPTLLKPGAEKLAALFQLDVQPQNEKRWEADNHLTVISRVTIFYAPTGTRLGSGEGVCTTRERKYAYRKAERSCPACGQKAVIKGKEEFGGGWLCWKKPERGKNGCGAKWPDGAEEIEKQEIGDVDNLDLPDLWNTVDKMATKRALVAAVLIVTGASAVFTQDVEDGVETASSLHEASPEAASPPKVDAATAGRIGKGITALGLNQIDINLILGALGANGLRGTTGADVRQAVEALTPDQGTAFESRLQLIAEEREQEVAAGQGGGDGDGE